MPKIAAQPRSQKRSKVIDPVKFINKCWPDITLYNKQRDILYSLADNDETIVPAGNMLGKDFITGLAVLWFFLSRNPCRIVTTSVDDTQLNAVLWGEIRRFIQSSHIALTTADGGPLLVNDMKIRKVYKGQICGLSYLLGRVATDDGTGFLGHHIADIGDGIPRTLFVADEASGVPDMYYDKADTWAKRKLIIGNPFPCSNFFKRNVRGGDLFSKDGLRCYRKIIKIKATDSPNVRLALAEIAAGLDPSHTMLVQGVKSYAEYCKNLDVWDKIKQCVSLYAEFYEGAEVLLFPPEIMANSAKREINYLGTYRQCVSIGCDPAEGGDDTVWTGIDEKGIIFQVSVKTPDTAIITGRTIALMKQYGVPAEMVVFDSGGGGKQHADRLRDQGYNVRTVAFGESVTDLTVEFNRSKNYRPLDHKIDEREDRYVYKNRRAEMYHMASQLVANGFCIPDSYAELHRQLTPIPLQYDAEGRIVLMPKNKKSATSKEVTLRDLLGRSPDQADSFVLAVYGMLKPRKIITAGGVD